MGRLVQGDYVRRTVNEACADEVPALGGTMATGRREAYSYVAVGGFGAQRVLAQPVADTLFFAGEATEFSGHHAKVNGALATGDRTAEAVLGVLGVC